MSTKHNGATADQSPSDALSEAIDIVDDLLQTHTWMELDRDDIHVGVCGWKRKNGVCLYNRAIGHTRVFDTRLDKQSMHNVDDEHTIVLNPQVYTQNRGTGQYYELIAHELAHAEAYAQYGSSQGHNDEWKRIARRLGVSDPTSRNSRRERDYDYWMGCPSCEHYWGKHRRSKKIRKANIYRCQSCGKMCGSAETKAAIEHETVKVDCSDL